MDAIQTGHIVWTAEDREWVKTIYKADTWSKVMLLFGLNRPPLDDATFKEAKGWEKATNLLLALPILQIEEEESEPESGNEDMSRYSSTRKRVA